HRINIDKNSYWINILSSSYFFNQTSTKLTHALTSATPPSFQLSHLPHKIKIAPGLPQFSLGLLPHPTLQTPPLVLPFLNSQQLHQPYKHPQASLLLYPPSYRQLSQRFAHPSLLNFSSFHR